MLWPYSAPNSSTVGPFKWGCADPNHIVWLNFAFVWLGWRHSSWYWTVRGHPRQSRQAPRHLCWKEGYPFCSSRCLHPRVLEGQSCNPVSKLYLLSWPAWLTWYVKFHFPAASLLYLGRWLGLMWLCALQTHLPGYVNDYEKLKEAGAEVIVCVSVNDPFVMAAWGEAHNATGKVRLFITASRQPITATHKQCFSLWLLNIWNLLARILKPHLYKSFGKTQKKCRTL